MTTAVTLAPIEDEQLAELVSLHERWMRANATVDRETLDEMWVDDPRIHMFSGTNHIYYGKREWARKWELYESQIDVQDCRSRDVRVLAVGDVAVISYIAEVPVAADEQNATAASALEMPEEGEKVFGFRCTDVFVRTDGQWWLSHCHYSLTPPEDEVRPGFGPEPDKAAA